MIQSPKNFKLKELLWLCGPLVPILGIVWLLNSGMTQPRIEHVRLTDGNMSLASANAWDPKGETYLEADITYPLASLLKLKGTNPKSSTFIVFDGKGKPLDGIGFQDYLPGHRAGINRFHARIPCLASKLPPKGRLSLRGRIEYEDYPPVTFALVIRK